MTDVSDPAWLYSTVAQSTAALVAIVGGFLVTRLITLASERANVTRVRDELAEVERGAQAAVAQAADAIKSYEIGLILALEFQTILDAQTISPAAEVFERHAHIVEHISVEDFELPYAGRVFEIPKAMNRLRPLVVATADLPEDPVQGLLQLEIPIQEMSDFEAWLAVYRHLWASERDPRPPRTDPPVPEGIGTLADRQAREEQLSNAKEAAHQATLNRQRADHEVQRLVRPEGVGHAFLVLAYFAVAGLVFPVVVLARQPTSDWWLLRSAVVVGLGTGLAGLLWFLMRVIRAATASES